MTEPSADGPIDELVVVGCGTVVPEADRGASSYWVSAEGARVLFDCGPGAVGALARLGLPWAGLSDLVITHFHADHVGALPGLFFALTHGLERPRTRPLAVWGPVGTIGFFERLAAAFGTFMLDPGFPIRVRELVPGDEQVLGGGPVLRAHKTPHTEESVAYRLDGTLVSFGYSGDSGPTDTLGRFMSGVAALLCECSLFDEEVGDNHLSPSRVSSIAKAANPRSLILTHIYPHLRLTADIPSLIARAGYSGETQVAVEGLRVTLTNR